MTRTVRGGRPDNLEPDATLSRRRIVAVTSVVGAGLLGASLSTKPGSPQFYGLTLGTAATWIVGGLRSGPLHRGWLRDRDREPRRPVVGPVAVGVVAFLGFYGCALVARHIPVLNAAIATVMRYARLGSSRPVLAITLINGAAEEVFFRGALYAAAGDRNPVVLSTTMYALATTATRNPALVLASAVMGAVFGLQRRSTGGIQAPMLTHLTWSTLMLGYLPALFDDQPGTGRCLAKQKPGC